MRYIGVDLHKTNFAARFLTDDDQAKVETFTFSPKGLAAFKSRLQPSDKVAVEISTSTFYFYSRIKPLVSEVVVVDAYRFAVIAGLRRRLTRRMLRHWQGF
jgi:hypothetical protein